MHYDNLLIHTQISGKFRVFFFLQWEHTISQYKKNHKNETLTEIYRTKLILTPPIKDP